MNVVLVSENACVQVMLFGASDSYSGDSVMQITLAFNHFGKGLIQRMPRVRWGFVHVVNNDYTHWLMYGVGGSQNPTIISQGNRFIAHSNLFTKEASLSTSKTMFAVFVSISNNLQNLANEQRLPKK